MKEIQEGPKRRGTKEKKTPFRHDPFFRFQIVDLQHCDPTGLVQVSKQPRSPKVLKGGVLKAIWGLWVESPKESKGPKIEKIQDRPPGLKFASEIENFKRATRQTLFFVGSSEGQD